MISILFAVTILSGCANDLSHQDKLYQCAKRTHLHIDETRRMWRQWEKSPDLTKDRKQKIDLDWIYTGDCHILREIIPQ